MAMKTWRSSVGAALAATGIVLAAVAANTAANGQGAASIAGIWLDDEGKASVEIKACGAEMCGNIVWLKEPNDKSGKPHTDVMNSDTSKRGRPICGLQIISGLKSGANGVWTGGQIYDPEEGKSFNLELSLDNPNTLKVFGYAGVRLLSETYQWKRLPADTPRCKS